MSLHIHPNTVYKRKFRWTIEGKFPGGEIEQHFVKVAARPELSIEEVELNGVKFPASQKWQSVTVTSYDQPKQMYSALTESYFEVPKECPAEKKGTVTLRLYDGCGWLLESWELNGAYFSKASFIEYDTDDVELTIQYDSAKYTAKENLTSLPPHLSPPPPAPPKIKCPNCQHEFTHGFGFGMCSTIF